MASEFPNFYGSTVTHETTAAGAHRIQTVMPFTGAPNDRIVVTTVAADAQIAYVTNKADVLFETVKYAAADAKELWQGRYDKAFREMRAGQIIRPVLAGTADKDWALSRLQQAGYTMNEAVNALGKEI
jgi:hypothetical protein